MSAAPTVTVKRVVQRPYSFLFPPGAVVKWRGTPNPRTAVIDRCYVVAGERYYDLYGKGWVRNFERASSVEGAWDCHPRPEPFLSRETHPVTERVQVPAPAPFRRFFQARDDGWAYSFFGSFGADIWECEVTPVRKVGQ